MVLTVIAVAHRIDGLVRIRGYAMTGTTFAKPNFPLSLAWTPSGFVLIAAGFLRFEGVVIQSFASLHRQCVMLEKVNEELNRSKNN